MIKVVEKLPNEVGQKIGLKWPKSGLFRPRKGPWIMTAHYFGSVFLSLGVAQNAFFFVRAETNLKVEFLPGVVFAKGCESLLVSWGRGLGSGSGGWWGGGGWFSWRKWGKRGSGWGWEWGRSFSPIFVTGCVFHRVVAFPKNDPPRGPAIEKIQSRSKISIPARNFQSRSKLFQSRSKISIPEFSFTGPS